MVWVGLEDGDLVTGHLDWRQRKLQNLRRDARVTLSFEAATRNDIGMRHHLVVHGPARITEGGAADLLGRLGQICVGPSAISAHVRPAARVRHPHHPRPHRRHRPWRTCSRSASRRLRQVAEIPLDNVWASSDGECASHDPPTREPGMSARVPILDVSFCRGETPPRSAAAEAAEVVARTSARRRRRRPRRRTAGTRLAVPVLPVLALHWVSLRKTQARSHGSPEGARAVPGGNGRRRARFDARGDGGGGADPVAAAGTRCGATRPRRGRSRTPSPRARRPGRSAARRC